MLCNIVKKLYKPILTGLISIVLGSGCDIDTITSRYRKEIAGVVKTKLEKYPETLYYIPEGGTSRYHHLPYYVQTYFVTIEDSSGRSYKIEFLYQSKNDDKKKALEEVEDFSKKITPGNKIRCIAYELYQGKLYVWTDVYHKYANFSNVHILENWNSSLNSESVTKYTISPQSYFELWIEQKIIAPNLIINYADNWA